MRPEFPSHRNPLASRRLPSAWAVAGNSSRGLLPLLPEPVSEQTDLAESGRARLEAVLWIADEPLTARRLGGLAQLEDSAEVHKIVAELRQIYASRRGALEIVSLAGGYQLLTRPEHAAWLDRAPGAKKEPSEERPLSGPMLETLAIVAHRQPVLRAEVEAIRGVGCGELLRQLLDADFLRIVGRSEELGKPLIYGTTKRFLEVFGLRKIEDLPPPAGEAGPTGPTKQNAPEELSEAVLTENALRAA